LNEYQEITVDVRACNAGMKAEKKATEDAIRKAKRGRR